MDVSEATLHQVVAAWVQAIGSIVAIIGAFLIARYQSNKQEQARQRELRKEAADTGDIVVAIGIDVVRAIRDSGQSFSRHVSGEKFVAETDRLDEALHSLRIVMAMRVDPAMMHSLLRIQRTATYSHRALRQRAGSTKAFSERTIAAAEGRHSIAARELSKIAKIRNALKMEVSG